MDGDGRSFRFTHSETGHVSASASWRDWKERIYKHREANGLPIPENMMEVAEDQLCGLLPPEWCKYEAGDKKPVNLRRLGVSDVKRWASAVTARLKSGDDLVSPAEAERRASICVRCPYNLTLPGCAGCSGLAKLVAKIATPGMANKKTSEDSRLKSCAVCGCFGKIMVHFPLSILSDEDAIMQDSFPEHCWRKIGGINHAGQKHSA